MIRLDQLGSSLGKAIKDRHQVRADLEGQDGTVDDAQVVDAIHAIGRINRSAEFTRHHAGRADRVPIGA